MSCRRLCTVNIPFVRGEYGEAVLCETDGTIGCRLRSDDKSLQQQQEIKTLVVTVVQSNIQAYAE
jgi:hypothetical protein